MEMTQSFLIKVHAQTLRDTLKVEHSNLSTQSSKTIDQRVYCTAL